jgi:hypothetical protein
MPFALYIIRNFLTPVKKSSSRTNNIGTPILPAQKLWPLIQRRKVHRLIDQAI